MSSVLISRCWMQTKEGLIFYGFFNFIVLERRVCIFVVLCIHGGRQSDCICFRGQTTKGIWIAKSSEIEPFTIAMDLEGTDSSARGEVLESFELVLWFLCFVEDKHYYMVSFFCLHHCMASRGVNIMISGQHCVRETEYPVCFSNCWHCIGEHVSFEVQHYNI